MTKYVALVRAVNVGGTRKLRMTELVAACHAAGLCNIETYIASGNVIFDSNTSAGAVKVELERRLQSHLHKAVGVMIRSAAELRAVLAANPFPQADPKFTYAIFLDEPPSPDALNKITGRKEEEIRTRTA